jgi:hypothetical protein
MKLKEYIEQLQKFAQMNPETLDMDVIYSRDDEGNGFGQVHYAPSKGIYEDMEFIASDQLEDYERDTTDINSVCIN